MVGEIHMQAYKLRKVMETVIYPVEDELRGIREENDKSWKQVVEKVGAVSFSGIGTTIAFQSDFIPALLQTYLHVSNKLILLFWEFFIALGMFVGITRSLWKLTNWRSKNKDEKKHDVDRRKLAEYFHKVILNNVLTGISFVKRAWNKKKEYDKKELLLSKLNPAENTYVETKSSYEDSQKYYIKEINLYISEALFYFKTANKQFNEKKIFEIGMRKAYIEFIDIVGLSTFINLLDMYEQSYHNMEELNSFMKDVNNKSDIGEIGEFITLKKLDLKMIQKEYLEKKNGAE